MVDERKEAKIEEIDHKKIVDVASFGNDPEPQQEVSGEPEGIQAPEPESAPEPTPGPEIVQVKSPEPQEAPTDVKKEDLDKLTSIRAATEQIHIAIGSLEIQKSQMIAQALQMRSDMEESAKDAMKNSGFTEESMKGYRVDVKSGKIISMRDMPPQMRPGPQPVPNG